MMAIIPQPLKKKVTRMYHPTTVTGGGALDTVMEGAGPEEGCSIGIMIGTTKL
jgi:hypothetical protein